MLANPGHDLLLLVAHVHLQEHELVCVGMGPGLDDLGDPELQLGEIVVGDHVGHRRKSLVGCRSQVQEDTLIVPCNARNSNAGPRKRPLPRACSPLRSGGSTVHEPARGVVFDSQRRGNTRRASPRPRFWITAQAMRNGVVGCLKTVGRLPSKTKWPNHMIAYERTNKASDQSGRNGKSTTAAAMIGQPMPTCRKWLTGWTWSSW